MLFKNNNITNSLYLFGYLFAIVLVRHNISKNDLSIKAMVPSIGLNYLILLSNDKRIRLDFNKIIPEKPKFAVINDLDVFYYGGIDRFHKNIIFTENVSLSIDEILEYGVIYDSKKENEKIIKEIYKLAKEARKNQRITQKQVSLFIDIPQSGIARIEKGETDVQLSTLLNYLSPLGLTLTITSKYRPNKKTIDAMNEEGSDESYLSVGELKNRLM